MIEINFDLICFILVIIIFNVMVFFCIFLIVFDSWLLIWLIKEEKFLLYFLSIFVILLLFLVNWLICWVNIFILFVVVILKIFLESLLINGNNVCLECEFIGFVICGIKLYINCLVVLRWFFKLFFIILMFIVNWCNVK